MKKVALFYKTYSLRGGQEKVVYNFSHFLAQRGYRVKVITSKVKEKPKVKDIEIQRIIVPNLGRGLRNLIFALMSYREALKLKKENYIIFGFGKTFYQDIFRAGGGVHKFYTERAQYKYESFLERKIYLLKKRLSLSYNITNLIEKLTFENPYLKKIIAPTDFVRRQIEENFSPKAKIFIIRNGVNLIRFNIRRKETLQRKYREALNLPNLPILGYVSSNFKLKGFSYLLEALYILKRLGINVLLLTAGESKRNWMKKVEKLGLKNNVIFLGHTWEVEKVYFSSDIFVYPTLFDASANVILESMASGLPVVASAYSGTEELIEDRGFIIQNPEDPEEIAKILKVVLSLRKDKLEEIGYKNFQIASKFPQEEVFEKFLQLIE